MAPDPYRVLGLNPGATAADVKRAYRALAKANHPDSAGERALPRFLAIQAAYEQLATPKGSATGRMARTPAAEPWRAEPERAREARRRAREAGRGQPSGSDPGASQRAGSAGQARSRTGSTGPSGGGATAGGSTAGGSTAGGQRRRAARKATFGSTSYDEARDSSDPSWEGAAWYGQSSGEFWTVNPREYADPRKHGPEYQSRVADRAARARARNGTDEAEAAGGPMAPDAGPATTRAGVKAQARARATAAANAAARADAEARTSAARSETAGFAQSAEAGSGHRTGEARSGPVSSGSGPGSPGEPMSFIATLLPSVDLSVLDRSSFRRGLLALIAWPPIGIAAAALIGESTGCAAFSTSCTPEGAALPWIAQAAILLVLLALPFLARILVGGTAAVLIVAFPAAAILSASGARYDRAYGPGSLLAILAVAWLIGVVIMGIRAARKRSAA